MTRLSSFQYPMLHAFAELGETRYMTFEDAHHWDQRPFRSMLIQKWVAYRPGHGFHITKLGRKAWAEFLNTDIARKNPQLPLTSYFDATAYGLANGRAKKGAA